MATTGWLVAAGCGGGEATKPNEAVAKRNSADPKPSVTPQPKPKVKTAEPTAIGADAVAGFERGPAPISTPDPHASWDGAEPLHHAGATVTVAAHVIASAALDEDQSARIRVRIEFDGADASRGLTHERDIGASYCDERSATLQKLATLDDGAWLLDAQLACRTGEDYFSGENAHTLIRVDAANESAALLWTGVDTGSDAMGVCSSASVHGFKVAGDELVISKTEHTVLDAQRAKQFPSAAEGCVAKPAQTEIVERVVLNPRQP